MSPLRRTLATALALALAGFIPLAAPSAQAAIPTSPERQTYDAADLVKVTYAAGFTKGVNVSEWFDYRVTNGDATFAFHTLAEDGSLTDQPHPALQRYSEDDFTTWKQLGIDVVRLNIDFSRFYVTVTEDGREWPATADTPGAVIDPHLYDRLKEVIGWANKSVGGKKITLIIDNHASRPMTGSQLASLWQDVAEELQDERNIVYEILNEPKPEVVTFTDEECQGRGDTACWGEVIQRNALRTITGIDRNTPVIVSGYNLGKDYAELPDYQADKDNLGTTRLIYTFHYYRPELIANVTWSGLDITQLGAIRFPAGLQAQPEYTGARTYVQNKLDEYPYLADPVTIAAEFNQIAAFAKQRKAALFCGEFSFPQEHFQGEDTLLYWRTLADLLTERNIAWTFFADNVLYTGTANKAYDQAGQPWGVRPTVIDYDAVRALGFTAQKPAAAVTTVPADADAAVLAVAAWDGLGDPARLGDPDCRDTEDQLLGACFNPPLVTTLYSKNGDYHLRLHADGNLVLYGPRSTPVWASGSGDYRGVKSWFVFDGNLKIYRTTDWSQSATESELVWETHVTGGVTLALDDSGTLSIQNAKGDAVWKTASTLFPGDTLGSTSTLVSPNGQYTVGFASNGNLVLTGPNNETLWDAGIGRAGATGQLVFGANSQLKVTLSGGTAWYTLTKDQSAAALTLEDTGQLVLRDRYFHVLWSTGSVVKRTGGEVTTALDGGLTSTNGAFRLRLTEDGVAEVIREPEGKVIWASPVRLTGAIEPVLQLDAPTCDIVIAERAGQEIWRSGTTNGAAVSQESGNRCQLLLRDDGALIVQDVRQKVLWSSTSVRADSGHTTEYTATDWTRFYFGVPVYSADHSVWVDVSADGRLLLHRSNGETIALGPNGEPGPAKTGCQGYLKVQADKLVMYWNVGCTDRPNNSPWDIRAQGGVIAEVSSADGGTLQFKDAAGRVVWVEPNTFSLTGSDAWPVATKGGTRQITLTANAYWEATSDQSWLKVSPSTGQAGATVNLTVPANTTVGGARTAIVTFTSGGRTKTITVTQDGVAPKITVAKSPSTITKLTTSVTLTVDSNVPWTLDVSAASPDSAWADPAVTSGPSGKTKVKVTLSKNTSGQSRFVTYAFQDSSGVVLTTVTLTQKK